MVGTIGVHSGDGAGGLRDTLYFPTGTAQALHTPRTAECEHRAFRELAGRVAPSQTLATLRASRTPVRGHSIAFHDTGTIGSPATLSARITPSSFFAVDR